MLKILNEIKNNANTNISDIIKPGGTSKLIKQYNLQYQQQHQQHPNHNFAKNQQSNNVNIFNNNLQIVMKKKGLYDNINARKKAGTSRPKSKSTIDPKVYKKMKSKKGGFKEK